MKKISINDKGCTGRDIAITTVFDIISKIGSAVISLLIIRILTVDEYADITFFNSIATFLSGVIGSGLTLSFVRYYAESISRGDANKGLFSFLLEVILSLYTIIACGFVIYSVINESNVDLLMMALLFSFFVSYISAIQAYFQANNSFSNAGLVGNLRVVLLLTVIVVVYILNKETFTPLVIMMAYVGTGLITVLIGLLSIKKTNRLSFQSDKGNSKVMLREGIWLMLYCLIVNLFNQLDIFMMNTWHMVNDVAQYGVAFKYYAIALSLLPAIQTVLRVKTANKNIIDSDKAKADIALKWIKKSALLVVAIVAVGELLAEPVLRLLNGTNYDEAIPIFRVLLIGMGISYMTAPNVSLMMSGNKQRIMCVIATFSLITNFICNYIFIPKFGGLAASYTTVVSQAILNVACTIIVIKKRELE